MAPGRSNSRRLSWTQNAFVLARASVTVPAGTVVQEFDFSVEGIALGTQDEPLVVAVRDLSHPERDQAALCSGDHPLDGCATLDYGAFGTIHDNRITATSTGESIVLHLWKNRSLHPEPEPLQALE